MNLKDSPIHLWTDAQVVLAWISSHPSRWKPFVANRVSEIQTSQPRASWRHISGLQNPADLTTRGITPHDLQTNSLWWHGPEWLTLSSSQWPAAKSLNDCPLLEERETVKAHAGQSHEPWNLLDRYSSLVRLQRITALCIRFVDRLKDPGMSLPSYLTAPELRHALQVLIKMVQVAHFSKDLKAIKRQQLLPKDSRLKPLAPLLDHEEILGLGGRLEHSLLPYEAKHPIILPPDSPLTELLIADAHLATLHGGSQITTAYLRRKFWIINARNRVRAHIHRCIKCFRQRPILGQQLMGNSPAERIQPSRPFTHTGLDYAGPVYARTTKGRGPRAYKAWIALFVCLATRAVHLELVSDCTTESFLSAFARFTSRRGLCSTVWSDNATTFRGADAELRELRDPLLSQQPTLAESFANQGIEWKFIPPGAPRFGGLWEAGVKSVKSHLKRVCGDQRLTFEEWSTLLARIEACLNSRPIHPLTDDPTDLDALTPAHFLVGTSLMSVPEPSTLEIPENRLNRWQLICNPSQYFWQRWTRDYLHHLQQRRKWQHVQSPLKINDLVVIKDENLPPAQWALDRVIAVYPGADGLIRVADVKTATSVLKRPIHKICVLPIEMELESN